MKKIRTILEAMVVITVVMALILPGSAVVTNDENSTGKIQYSVKEYIKNLPIEGSQRGDNILMPSGEGDDRLPSITMDEAGHSVVTWTNEEDISTWNMGIAYSDNPTDPMSWTAYIITLDQTEMIWYSDTAYVSGPGPEDYKGLYGANLYFDTDQAGGYEITDITQDPGDTEYWSFFSWDQDIGDQVCRAIEDGGLYAEPYHHPDEDGPVSMFIHRLTDFGFDIPGCPGYMNTAIEEGSTTFFWDAQAKILDAPARDCDLATSLPDWFHLTWEYHNETTDVNQIVWKKIVPTEEADIEYTEYFGYIAEGTNPSIEAYDTGSGIQVAVVYSENGQVECVYSNDDGENWQGPVTVANGVYPALRAIGTTLYCAYIDDNNLYLRTSEDGGITWSEASERINDEEGSVEEEENAVDIHLGGIVWVDDRNGDLKIYWAALDVGNNPPGAPDISGPTNGNSGQSITFTFSAEDPDGDDVRFLINWGDGDSDTTTYVGSGDDQTASHSWKGDEKVFTLSVRAEDANGLAGPASTFDITIPRSRAKLYDLFDIFPNLFRLLNLIFG